MSEVRGSGREELPHVQGAAAVWVQEGQEEPLHIQDTPREEIPLVQGKEQWLRHWKRSVFIPVSKKGNAKECSNYCTVALIAHARKLMLKILQARF